MHFITIHYIIFLLSRLCFLRFFHSLITPIFFSAFLFMILSMSYLEDRRGHITGTSQAAFSVRKNAAKSIIDIHERKRKGNKKKRSRRITIALLTLRRRYFLIAKNAEGECRGYEKQNRYEDKTTET